MFPVIDSPYTIIVPEKQKNAEIKRLPFEYRLEGPKQQFLYDDFDLHQRLAGELLEQFLRWFEKDFGTADVQPNDLIMHTVQLGRVNFYARQAVDEYLRRTYPRIPRAEFDAISIYVFYAAWGNYVALMQLSMTADRDKQSFFERVTLDLRQYVESAQYQAKTDPIPNFLFTAQMAWYTEICFADFSYFISRASVFSNFYDLVVTMLVAGYTADLLSPQALAGTSFVDALLPIYPAVQVLLPTAVRQRVEECLTQSGRSQPTKELKSFWHEVFVHHWVAQEQSVGNQSTAISPSDRQQLMTDPAVAAKFRPLDGTQSTRRVGSMNAVKLQEVEQQRAREQLRIVDNLKRTNRNMQAAFNRLLASYGLNVQVFSPSGDVSPSWEDMRRKSGKLLQIFLKDSSKLLSTELTQNEKLGVLEATTTALKECISEPTAGKQTSLNALFGTAFESLSQLEQCMIILYGVLSLGYRISDQLTSAVVQILGKGMQSLLDVPQFLVRQDNDSTFSSPHNHELEDFVAVEHERKALFMKSKAEQLCELELGPNTQSNIWKNNVDYNELLDLLSRLSNVDRSNWQFFFYEKVLMKFAAFALVIAAIGELANIDTVTYSAALIAVYSTLLSSSALFRQFRVRARQVSLQGFEDLVRSRSTETWVANFPALYDEWGKFLSKHQKAILRGSDLVSPIVLTMVVAYISGLYIARNETISFDLSAMHLFEGNSILNTLLGEYADRTSIEIPDQKNVEEVRNTHVRSIGQIHQFPVGASTVPGSRLGYRIDEMLTELENEQTLEVFGPWGNSYAVQEISADTYHASDSNELIYSIVPARYIYPLQGYTITKVFYEGGDAPLIGTAGTLYFSGKVPNEVLIVSVPSPLEEVQPGVLWYPGLFESTTSIQNWDSQRMEALTLNTQLSGDPGLQQLHQSAIQRIDALYNQYQYDLKSEQVSQAYDTLIVSLASELKQYFNESRTYSLRYQNPDFSGDAGTLVGITQAFPEGFYCLVANKSFAEFFESLGVSTMLAPGENVFVGTEDELLVRFGHVKSVLLLTSGSAVLVDATPARPNPAEDLAFMSEAVVSPDGSLLAEAEWLAGLITSVSAGTLLIRGAKKIRRRYRVISRSSNSGPIEWQLQQALPSDSSQRMAVVSAVQQLLLLTIDYERRGMVPNPEQLTNDLLFLAYEAKPQQSLSDLHGTLEEVFLGTVQKLSRSMHRDIVADEATTRDLLTEKNQQNIRATLVEVINQLPVFLQKYLQEQADKRNQLLQEINRQEGILGSQIASLEKSLIARISGTDLPDSMDLWREVQLSNEYVISNRTIVSLRKQLQDMDQMLESTTELSKSLERCLRIVLQMMK